MTSYTITEHALLQDVGDETVILNLDSGEYFTLDAIGTQMVKLFKEDPDPAAVATKITKKYDVDFDQAQSDLIKLLEEMMAHGLVAKDEA